MSVSQSQLSVGAGTDCFDALGAGDLTLPGYGESAEDCEEWRVAGFCDGPKHADGESSHVALGVHRCGRRGCSECWSSWARDRAVSSVVRLGAFADEQPDGIDRRTVHAAVSPPPGSVGSVSELFETRREAVDRAKAAGIRGGIVVPHAFRTTDEADREYRRADTELAKWAWVRECDRPWQDLVEWSPHYHVIGMSRKVEAGDDGWAIKRLSTMDEWHRDSRSAYESRAGAVRYVLSHAAFPETENRQVATWYGELHGVNFDPAEDLTRTALGQIEQLAEEVVGADVDDGGLEDGGDDMGPCPVDECPGRLHPIHDLYRYLDDAGRSLGRLNQMVLRAALRWSRGDIEPPPGLKSPETFDDAHKGLVKMVQLEFAGTTRWEGLRSEEGSDALVERAGEMVVGAGG